MKELSLVLAIIGVLIAYVGLFWLIENDSNRQHATIAVCELRLEIGRLDNYCVEKLIEHNRISQETLYEALRNSSQGAQP